MTKLFRSAVAVLFLAAGEAAQADSVDTLREFAAT